jgi:hypothetical protein
MDEPLNNGPLQSNGLEHRAPPRGACGTPLGALRGLDAGELAGEELARVRGHVDGCAECRTVLADFEAERRALAVALPLPALERRLAARPPRWPRLVLGVLLPAAAALGAWALATRPDDEAPAAVRAKGGDAAELSFLVKTADGAREGVDGERLRAGDALRLRYAGPRPFVLVFGVDADARVFPYVAAGDRSAPAAAGRQLSPGAVTLDADPRPERIFALWSDTPVGLDEVRLAAREGLQRAGSIERLERLPLPGDQATVLLRKAGGAP